MSFSVINKSIRPLANHINTLNASYGAGSSLVLHAGMRMPALRRH